MDVQYLEEMHKRLTDLSFLSESMKIGRIEKIVARFYDGKGFIKHIRNLKQALTQGLVKIG